MAVEIGDSPLVGAGGTIDFRPYRLVPALRLLLKDAKPVPLGSRATDILVALASRAGEPLSKEELIAAAWPNRIVDDVNLRYQIAAIRRALGDGEAGQRYLATIPGRGYCFVAPIERSPPVVPDAPAAPAGGSVSRLPPRLTRVVGRSALVSALCMRLTQRRLLTLVGPAGIGKTTVALSIAHELEPSYTDGAVFVDLGTATAPELVPTTLTAALGFSLTGADSISSLIAFLKDKQGLLVLDGCEHVIDVSAAIAEEIYRNAPGMHILATSREPLHSAGEHVSRITPLETPAEPDGISLDEAMSYAAIELFVERAAANVDSFELTEEDVPIVADICRRLDGIALAIELAASRVDVFGLRELAARLDDRFRFLTSGRRTAPARHRTLEAALDWSYQLLPEAESAMLRRLAAFMGPFDLEGATAVACVGADAHAMTALANLVSKSMVVADQSTGIACYRLLNTTRIYASSRLVEAGELEASRRRHAEYHRDLFARARGEWETEQTAAWLAEYGHRLTDLRATLDWAFSPGGDHALGVALTADAVPLWLQLSLMRECRQRVATASAHIGEPTPDNARLRMRLATAQGLSRMYLMDPVSEVDAGWRETLYLAEQLGDHDYQRRAIWGLFANAFNSGNYREALGLAGRFHALGDTADDRLIGERLVGTALHLLGEQLAARQHIERMLARYIRPPHSSHIIRYQNDQVIAARRVLAPILWLLGHPEQAMRMLDETVREAAGLSQPITLCNLLAQAACPIALLAGDLVRADRFTAMLLEQSGRHTLDTWHAYGQCYEAMARIRRGDFQQGVLRLRNATDDLRRAGFTHNYTFLLGALAEGLALAGAIEAGLETIDAALARIDTTAERWCFPELLRIKGELLLLQDGEAASAPERLFRESLDWATQQRVPAWQLRSAVSLARLLQGRGRADEAAVLLRPIYELFTEGFDTDDLKVASTLLHSLG